jgi:putative FmdB family regulatory protein
MPIYEFICSDCNTIFNFFARAVNTTKRPLCPRCGKKKLVRQVSLFSTGSSGEKKEEGGDLPVDDAKMERAVEALASEAEGMSEDDPRQAAQLMRKFSKMTGMEFGSGMESALARLEAGEDPEKIESEMGEALDGEDPFVMGGGKSGKGGRRKRPPSRDNTLYEL